MQQLQTSQYMKTCPQGRLRRAFHLPQVPRATLRLSASSRPRPNQPGTGNLYLRVGESCTFVQLSACQRKERWDLHPRLVYNQANFANWQLEKLRLSRTTLHNSTFSHCTEKDVTIGWDENILSKSNHTKLRAHSMLFPSSRCGRRSYARL